MTKDTRTPHMPLSDRAYVAIARAIVHHLKSHNVRCRYVTTARYALLNEQGHETVRFDVSEQGITCHFPGLGRNRSDVFPRGMTYSKIVARLIESAHFAEHGLRLAK